MAIFRLPLILDKKIKFWKLMGSGKNGTFDIHPDFSKWAALLVFDRWDLTGDSVDKIDTVDSSKPIDNRKQEAVSVKQTPVKSHLSSSSCRSIPSFIKNWLSFFHCGNTIFFLEPIEGHGLWDGKEVFGHLPKQSLHEGKIAVLTRATIKINRLKNFWKHVDAVAVQMAAAPGFIESYGIGEVPWIKQATFSTWENKEAMKAFAYSMKAHKEVIQKTRKENWYSEEMFVRFKVVDEYSSLAGCTE
jgi:heme-degrading monooxygenase HmoA